jgi:hypothetical protein
MKNHLKIILLIIAGCVILFSLTANASKEKSELKFSHKKHVIENELDCASCHTMAESSESGKDNLMPNMESCGSCHDLEATDKCGICHSDTENPRNVPRVENFLPGFSHKLHFTAEVKCNDCHSRIEKKEVVEPYLLPAMEACQQCHSDKKVKPNSHGPNYQHTHGDDAKSKSNPITASQSCNLCHSQRFCQYCHEGDNLDRVTHPLNYAFTHSLDAGGKERECAVCHTERAFCIECHAQNFVMPHNHVLGWAIPNVGGTHVSEAQNDLESCMSCHEANAEISCQKSGCHIK